MRGALANKMPIYENQSQEIQNTGESIHRISLQFIECVNDRHIKRKYF